MLKNMHIRLPERRLSYKVVCYVSAHEYLTQLLGDVLWGPSEALS